MADQPSLSSQADAAYRRGTVLGLTVAEVFILLLFLLMLAFLGFTQAIPTSKDYQQLRKELAETQSVLEDVREHYEPWESVIRKFPVPDEILTLRDDLRQARESRDQAREGLTAAAAEAFEARKAAEEAHQLTDEARQLAKEAREAEEAAKVLLEKGHNPPCWYELVPDGRGGLREKPHYTFDVAVFDRHMILRRVPTPPGGVEDDTGTTHHSEAVRLGLDKLPYGSELSDRQFQQLLLPIHRAGKGGKVRRYSCIFWVRVWDRTSPDAKARWQQAHDVVIEGLFGAYQVKDRPWSMLQ